MTERQKILHDIAHTQQSIRDGQKHLANLGVERLDLVAHIWHLKKITALLTDRLEAIETDESNLKQNNQFLINQLQTLSDSYYRLTGEEYHDDQD